MSLPGPRPTPWIGYRGNLLKLIQNPLGELRHLQRRFGNFAAVTRDDPSYVCAFGPDHARTLFSDSTLFEQFFSVLQAPPGSALERLSRNALVVNGDSHRRQRRVMAAPFQRRRSESYHADMLFVAERVLAEVQPGECLELTTFLRRITLGAILQIVFGIDAQSEPTTFTRAELILGRFLAQLGSELAILFPVDWPGSQYRSLLRQAESVEELILELLQRRSRPNPASDIPARLDAGNRDEGSEDPRGDLIGQLVTLLLAGQETTNNALCWALVLLAQHPDLQSALADEVRGTVPTVEELAKLSLMDAVVKETLRLLPPAANGARRATAEFELAGRTLPAGSVIIFSEYVSHHLSHVFPEPDRFLPERWARAEPSAFEYFPFGAGGRSCIGNHFAIQEMKIVLALLLQKFAVELSDSQQIDFILKPALAPRAGVRATFKPRGQRVRPAKLRGQILDAVRFEAAS